MNTENINGFANACKGNFQIYPTKCRLCYGSKKGLSFVNHICNSISNRNMKTVVLAVAFAALAAAQSPPPPPPSGDSVLVLPVHLVGLTSGNLPADASADLISTFAFEISSFLNQELVGYAQVLVPGGSGIHVNITSRLDSQWATVVSMIPVLQSPSLANVLAQSMFAIANSPIFADAMPNTIAAASKIASIDVKLSAAPPAVRPASNPAPAPTELPPPPSQPAVCTLITTLQLSDVAVADLTASLCEFACIQPGA